VDVPWRTVGEALGALGVVRCTGVFSRRIVGAALGVSVRCGATLEPGCDVRGEGVPLFERIGVRSGVMLVRGDGVPDSMSRKATRPEGVSPFTGVRPPLAVMPVERGVNCPERTADASGEALLTVSFSGTAAPSRMDAPPAAAERTAPPLLVVPRRADSGTNMERVLVAAPPSVRADLAT